MPISSRDLQADECTPEAYLFDRPDAVEQKGQRVDSCGMDTMSDVKATDPNVGKVRDVQDARNTSLGS